MTQAGKSLHTKRVGTHSSAIPNDVILPANLAACPHCHGLGITDLSRSRSSRGWPATCRICGKLSYNGSRTLRVLMAIFGGSIAPAAALISWFSGHRAFAMIICAMTLLAGFVVTRHADPHVMLPVTLEQKQVSRSLAYACLFALLTLLVAALVYALRKHDAAF